MGYEVGLKKIEVTIESPRTRVTSTPTYVTTIEVHNKTGNSNAYFGDSDVDSNWAPIQAEETKGYSSGADGSSLKGDYFDLSKFYVAGTSGDVVIVQYVAKVG